MEQPPELAHETERAFNALRIPRFGLLQWTEEHLIEAKRVGTVFLHKVVGILHIVFRLRHLLHFRTANVNVVAVLVFLLDEVGVFQVVAPLATRWNVEDVVAYHINIDVNRVAEQLTVRYVFGYEDDASIVLFTLNESRNFLACNQILDFLLNDMCSSPIVIQNIDVGHQKQLVAF